MGEGKEVLCQRKGLGLSDTADYVLAMQAHCHSLRTESHLMRLFWIPPPFVHYHPSRAFMDFTCSICTHLMCKAVFSVWGCRYSVLMKTRVLEISSLDSRECIWELIMEFRAFAGIGFYHKIAELVSGL